MMFRLVRHAAAGVALFIVLFAASPRSAHAAEAQESYIGPGNSTVYREIGTGYVIDTGGVADVVRRFLADQGWHDQATRSLAISGDMADARTGARMVRFSQQIGGLTIYNASVKALFDADGALTTLTADLSEAGRPVVPARAAPRAALNAALGAVHPGVAPQLEERGRSGNRDRFGGDDFFFSDPTVTRVAIPGPGAALHEAFLVETWTVDENLLDLTIVDGFGTVVHTERRTVSDSYNVFEEYPGVSPQAPVVTVDGQWLNGGPQTSTHIQGPNVDAYMDYDHDNLPDAGGAPVTDGAFMAVHDDALDPMDGFNPDVAVQNLFYLNNRIHDDLAPLGFDAASGNFEGDDPVLAEAQDGSRLNNANFSPTPDGTSPRMQMFLWSTAIPYRDSALDGDIVLHEYGHGITWRLIGDLVNFMGGAVGEGWSDTYALVNYDDDVIGEYSDNNPNGIRNYPYATYFEDSGGRTYEDFVFQVHADGEIFAAIQWKIWESYRDDVAIANARDLLLADMLYGMKITSVVYEYRPDFIDMRDGLLLAISGEASPFTAPSDPSLRDRWCYVWTANAWYGVGLDATTTVKRRGKKLNWTWTNGFEVPTECPALPPRNISPEVNIISPEASSIVSGTMVVLAAEASDSDGTVDEVDFVIDGTITITASDQDNDNIWTATWNSEIVADGSHSIVAIAKDDGTSPPESTTSTPVVVTVDNVVGGPTLVGVTAISYGSHGGKNGDRNLDVYLTVKDDTGALVEGASVLVAIFHGATLASEITYGVSGADGIAVITWKNAFGSPTTDCYWTDIRNIATTPYFWDGVEIETASICD